MAMRWKQRGRSLGGGITLGSLGRVASWLAVGGRLACRSTNKCPYVVGLRIVCLWLAQQTLGPQKCTESSFMGLTPSQAVRFIADLSSTSNVRGLELVPNERQIANGHYQILAIEHVLSKRSAVLIVVVVEIHCKAGGKSTTSPYGVLNMAKTVQREVPDQLGRIFFRLVLSS